MTDPRPPDPLDRPSSGAKHPSRDELEAAVFGWLLPEQAAVVRAHAAGCPRCGPALAAEDEVRQRLAVLRVDEPRVHVLGEVMRRVDAPTPARERGGVGWLGVPVLWPARRRLPIALSGLAAVLCLLFLGAALLRPESLQAAAGWLRSVVVREVPPPDRPGAPAGRVGTPGPTGGPIRRVSLEEARRLVAFPVVLPHSVPADFALDRVAVFQPDPAAPPTQVFVTYTRLGAHQPLTLTYQSPAAGLEAQAAPGAVREMVVGGHRAVYVDAALEGVRPAAGADAPLQLGRLIVERLDTVLVAAGDRRDGLDADALAAVIASIP